MEDEEAVVFSTISARGGYKIGTVTLNRPEVLNALNLHMVEKILARIRRWRSSKKIAVVLIKGSGRRGFCGGGDLSSIYDSLNLSGEERFAYVDAFLKKEYELNLLLRRFTRPVVTWGSGLVYGGGLGLFLSGSHRVGTQSLSMAWPEARIGYFPDVLGSYYLARLPPSLGRWMGLTGAALNAEDSRAIGLTHYSLPDDCLNCLIEDLRRLPWQENLAMNHALVREAMAEIECDCPIQDQDRPPVIEGWLESADQLEVMISSKPTGYPLLTWIASQRETGNPWIDKGILNAREAWPQANEVICSLQQRAGLMSLNEVANMELAVAWRLCRAPFFREGIKNRFIDKNSAVGWEGDQIGDVKELFRLPLHAA